MNCSPPGFPSHGILQARILEWVPTPVLLPGKSVDGGAWWAAVLGVANSWTRLSDFTFTFYFHVLEKEMATHSSVLAWRIPGTGEPGGLPSLGSHRVGYNRSDLVVVAFSKGSSQPRDRTWVSCIAGRFFTFECCCFKLVAVVFCD